MTKQTQELRNMHLSILKEIDKKYSVDFNNNNYEQGYFLYNYQDDYICRFKLKDPFFKNWIFKIWIELNDEESTGILGENKFMIDKFKPGHTRITSENIDEFINELNQFKFVNNLRDRNFKDKELREKLEYLIESEKMDEKDIIFKKLKKKIKLNQILQIKAMVLKYSKLKKYFNFKISYNKSLLFPEMVELNIVPKNNSFKKTNKIKLYESLMMLFAEFHLFQNSEYRYFRKKIFYLPEVKKFINNNYQNKINDGLKYEDLFYFNEISTPNIVLDESIKNFFKKNKG